jgi:hypothetical protein
VRVGRAAVDMLACGLRGLFRRLLGLTPASPRGGLFAMSRPPTADRVDDGRRSVAVLWIYSQNLWIFKRL